MNRAALVRTVIETRCFGGKPCKQLTGLGWCPAIHAGDLKAGMTITYNFGYKGRVLAVTPLTDATIEVKVAEGKYVYTRRYRKTSLVVAE